VLQQGEHRDVDPADRPIVVVDRHEDHIVRPARQPRQALADLVRLHRVAEITQAVYVAADLLILPSLSEGMPAVVIESGLVGTPAIASAVGAIPEMIEDGVTGFLAPPGQPDVLAQRVRDALPTARRVGLRARASFSHRYSMTTVVPCWAAALEQAATR
jgi:glycosyltransferase involved in cell wall biosynthesis